MADDDQDFVAKVALQIDPASLDRVGQQIKAALEKATAGIDLKAISELAKSVKILADDTAKAATNAEKLKQAEERTAQEVQKTLLATQRVATEKERTLGLAAKSAAESERSTKAAQEEAKAVAAVAEARLRVNQAFTLGNVGGAIGDKFFSTMLSGGGLNSAISQLGQLQPALFKIAQGGDIATEAFNSLGIKGIGAVSGLTSGLAAMGVAALAVVPVIGAIKDGIVGAYESQKDFVFQSGLLAKQLGTTAEEGAQLRSLLTVVGQQDNIFAAITLNQIQASVAALDRVNKGLDVATPQVEKFSQALKSLGVSYTNNNGSLKTFAELVVDISAGLQKLDTAQRSLAVQNLAGLFGGDVAKIFGEGPERLTSLLQNAVVVTKEQSAANDDLQVSLANLSSAQTAFNIQLTNGLTPLETWVNTFKTGVLREASDVLAEIAQRITGINAAALAGGGEDLGASITRFFSDLNFGKFNVGGMDFRSPLSLAFNAIFPDEESLRARSTVLKELIATLSTGGAGAAPVTLSAYEAELAKIQERLEIINELRIGGFGKERGGGAFDAGAASNAALIKQYKELDGALKDVQDAEKALADIQKEIVKNNLDIAKSFDGQINALQKTADGYDKFYDKIGEIQSRIDDRQSKTGKPISWFGDGSKVTNDIELAIANVRVMEERLGKIDVGKSPAAFDKLALQIRRLRASLGLQTGEAANIENVDVKFGYSGLSAKDKQKLEDDIAALTSLKKEFLQGGFDVTQSTFALLAQGLGGLSRPEFLKFLEGGAGTLQNFADGLGLFASPGFAQAIGESALQAKLLAGGFGEINTAAGAASAFQKYVDAFGDLHSELFDLSKYIADPSLLNIDSIFKDLANYKKNPTKFTIPIAIELGLVSEGNVTFLANEGSQQAIANRLTQALLGEDGTGGGIGVQTAQNAQNAVNATQQKLQSLNSGQGIVAAILARYGVTPGEAIKASLDFTLDLKADNTLVDKQIKAQDKLAKELGETKNINAKWNLNIDLNTNVEGVRAYLQRVLAALGIPGTSIPPQNPPGGGGGGGGGTPAEPFASGGSVFKGIPIIGGEGGKPELFVPRSDGRIIPGNETASLMRLFSGTQRTPAVPSITYAPVSYQNLTVDARGTNARDVTQAIKRTQAKQSLFTSSSAIVRDRDFLRTHGIR